MIDFSFNLFMPDTSHWVKLAFSLNNGPIQYRRAQPDWTEKGPNGMKKAQIQQNQKTRRNVVLKRKLNQA